MGVVWLRVDDDEWPFYGIELVATDVWQRTQAAVAKRKHNVSVSIDYHTFKLRNYMRRLHFSNDPELVHTLQTHFALSADGPTHFGFPVCSVLHHLPGHRRSKSA